MRLSTSASRWSSLPEACGPEALALLADATRDLADVGAFGLAIYARRLGRRPPTPRHTYGLKRVEVVAALINAAALIAISALIGREAVARLFHPEPVHASVMLVAAAVAFVANVGSVLLLRTHTAEDINVRSAFLHLAQDALASLAVVLAAFFARTAVGRYRRPGGSNSDRSGCPSKRHFDRLGIAAYLVGGCSRGSGC